MSEGKTCASFRAASFSPEFLSSAARALQARSEEASAISSAFAALDALSAASLAATCSKRSSWPHTASVRRQCGGSVDKQAYLYTERNKNHTGTSKNRGKHRVCPGFGSPALEVGCTEAGTILVKGKARSSIAMRKMKAEVKLCQVAPSIWVGIVGLV